MTSTQPAPIANQSTPTWELVIQRVHNKREARREAGHDVGDYDDLIASMRERDATGRAEYGTPLQPHNGRDSLADALDEALDLAVYAENAYQEHPIPALRQFADEASWLALRMVRWMRDASTRPYL